MSEILSMYVICDHPADYPDHFIVRRHDIDGNGNIIVSQELYMKDEKLSPIMTHLNRMGLRFFRRDAGDASVIIGTFL